MTSNRFWVFWVKCGFGAGGSGWGYGAETGGLSEGGVMVEPLSVSLGAVVAALIVKAAEKAGEAALEGGAGVLGRLVAAVRQRFSSAGDAQATAALERVEDLPVGPKQRDALAGVIDAYAAEDGGWAEQLQALVGEADRGGVDVAGVVQQVYGDHNVTIADVKGSTISIHGRPPGG
jgi:hypothetical protein